MDQNLPPVSVVIVFDQVEGKLAEVLASALRWPSSAHHYGCWQLDTLRSPKLQLSVYVNPSVADRPEAPDIIFRHPDTDREEHFIRKRMRVRRQEVIKEKFFSVRPRGYRELGKRERVVLISRVNADYLHHAPTLLGEVIADIHKIAQERQLAVVA